MLLSSISLLICYCDHNHHHYHHHYHHNHHYHHHHHHHHHRHPHDHHHLYYHIISNHSFPFFSFILAHAQNTTSPVAGYRGFITYGMEMTFTIGYIATCRVNQIKCIHFLLLILSRTRIYHSLSRGHFT